jgi:hypothetical protein
MRKALPTAAALGLVALVTPIACAGLVLATLIFLPLPATLPQAEPTSGRTTHAVDIAGNEIGTFKEYETATIRCGSRPAAHHRATVDHHVVLDDVVDLHHHLHRAVLPVDPSPGGDGRRPSGQLITTWQA